MTLMLIILVRNKFLCCAISVSAVIRLLPTQSTVNAKRASVKFERDRLQRAINTLIAQHKNLLLTSIISIRVILRLSFALSSCSYGEPILPMIANMNVNLEVLAVIERQQPIKWVLLGIAASDLSETSAVRRTCSSIGQGGDCHGFHVRPSR